MAAWRRAIELSLGDADVERLRSIAQSRTEPASRVERARILLAYREDWAGLLRFNRRLISHRAQVLSELLAERWGIDGSIRDLPDRPTWWINTTCFETGKNWRFAKREMGDWQFGRHYDPPFLLAEAVAASAALPYAIGALRLQVPPARWYRPDPATRRPLGKRS